MKIHNKGLDMLKVVLMILICTQHAFSMTGLGTSYEGKLFNWCVPCFALISGYFGVRYNLQKIVRLWGLALVLCVVPAVGECLSDADLSFWRVYRKFLFSNWYLNAYCILILLSPLLNAGLDELQKRGKSSFVPIFVLMLWAWASEAHWIRDFVPVPRELGSLTFSTLLFSYVAGYLCRTYDITSFITHRRYLLLFLIGLASIPFFGNYTYPICVLTGIFVFSWFKRLEIKRGGGGFLVPSVFPVYLLHTNQFGYRMLKVFASWFMNTCHCPRIMSLFLAGMVMFVACCAVDIVRRAGMLCMKKMALHRSL